jgi:hypothetical protein
MVKTIFLQDIKDRCNFNDDNIMYWSRDRLISAIQSIIKKVEKEITRTYSLKKNQLLCKDEKKQIEEYIVDRMSNLVDTKTNLIELKRKISGEGKNVDVEKEFESVLRTLPKDKYG